jgi:isoleucyl-tRNA synthetase
MPELERWVLHRLWQLDSQLRQACEHFQFHAFFAELHTFCAVDLSAFYFDIRKDALYCDSPEAPRRRAARTVLDALFDCLTAWLAPFLCFTAEEAWLARNPRSNESVHLRLFPEISAEWRDNALAERWSTVRRLRRVITGALEVERATKRIGSSLQAHPRIWADASYREAAANLDIAELAITSAASFAEGVPPDNAFRLPEFPGVAVEVQLAQGEKCDRCWQVLPEVGRALAHPTLCGRCVEAVELHRAAAE